MGNDGLYGPIFIEEMTVGDGDDILAPPAGYESNKQYKKSENQVRRRYIDPVSMMFGCTVNEPQQFKTQLVNGIMGLPAVSNTFMTTPNILDQLISSGQISRNQFSVCFGDDGGVMTFGGFNKDMHIPGEKVQTFEWKKMSNYEIEIPGIYVDNNFSNNLADNESYRFVLDSGTTYLWVPSKVYFGIIDEVDKYCKAKVDGEKRCLGLPEGETFTGRCTFYNTESGLEGGLEAYLSSYPKI